MARRGLTNSAGPHPRETPHTGRTPVKAGLSTRSAIKASGTGPGGAGYGTSGGKKSSGYIQ